MKIVCPRCASPNSRWEKRCYACWLPIDAALRTGAQAPNGALKGSADARAQAAANAASPSLTDLLGIEVEHVRALAAADLGTLEDIARALPETLEGALRVCTPIDSETLIARARQHVHSARIVVEEQAEPPAALVDEPNPDEWWKIR